MKNWENLKMNKSLIAIHRVCKKKNTFKSSLNEKLGKSQIQHHSKIIKIHPVFQNQHLMKYSADLKMNKSYHSNSSSSLT